VESAIARYDCAVIGAGPAGLTASIYLARYRRRMIVFDGGPSRARWIPESHNCPGFPGGISGDNLLERLRAQLGAYEPTIASCRVDKFEADGDGFVLIENDRRLVFASKVLLATGIVDVLPDVEWIDAAIAAGAMRLCAVCDAYEITDKRIAVYGTASSAVDHALFLRTYSRDVTVVLADEHELSRADAERAREAGIRIFGQSARIRFDGIRCSFAGVRGEEASFDSSYPFLGCQSQSSLATDLGALCDDSGALRVTPDQMSTVEGIYAAGDVVSSLNQISVAVGQAGVAATAIHNALPQDFR
jgi:thioredoxin reductase (NADPH)